MAYIIFQYAINLPEYGLTQKYCSYTIAFYPTANTNL